VPAKNSVKIYIPDSYYHVYNRGAGKSEIFTDHQDYNVFLHYLQKYLDKSSDHKIDGVKLLAYCLMPNHFHLFVYQENKDGLIKFMRALSTSYAMYFNLRWERSGTIFQGIYKAARIEEDSYFLHLSRYIHLNPAEVDGGWENYKYSSYKDFLGERKTTWIDPMPVLNYFKPEEGKRNLGHLTYQSFVEDSVDSGESLGELAIDYA